MMVGQDIYDVDSLVEMSFDHILASNESSTSTSSSSVAARPPPETLVSSSDIVEVTTNSSPLHDILKIFPDAKKSLVTSTLEKHNYNIEGVVQDFLEHGYEREPKVVPVVEKKKQEIDFMSTTSFELTAAYREQAYILLQQNFPYFQVIGLKALLNGDKAKGHYAVALNLIEKTLGIDCVLHVFSSEKPNKLVHFLPELAHQKDQLLSLGLKMKATKSKPSLSFSYESLEAILREVGCFLSLIKLKYCFVIIQYVDFSEWSNHFFLNL